MPTTLRTPGVYVNEISTLPPSVAAVRTAIPGFVGYTEKAGKNNEYEDKNKPIRISSMLDFETLFGGAPPMEEIKVTLDDTGKTVSKVEPTPAFYLYHSMQLFYANGGGSCYIVSVGDYNTTITKTSTILKAGFEALKIEDEPTLYVCPDAVLLSDINDCRDVHSKMLDDSQYLQDRFSILDVYQGDTIKNQADEKVVDNFREIPSSSNLKYGAAYYPFVRSSIKIPFDHGRIKDKDGSDFPWETHITDQTELLGALTKANINFKAINTILNEVKINTFFSDTTATDPEYTSWFDAYNAAKEEDSKTTNDTTRREKVLGLLIKENSGSPSHTGSLTNIVDDNEAYGYGDVPDLSLKKHIELILSKSTGASTTYSGKLIDLYPTSLDENTIDSYFSQVLTILNDLYEYAKSRINYLEDLLAQSNSFYAHVKEAVENQGLILPPSAMMAGVYARVDNLNGVWKAPANVGLNMVIAPTVKISHEMHGELNVHSTGKSINAIRSYIGKGNMVMGARTLAGNSNEWRYISVRRLFIMVEESVQEACEQFLFEANDANTWTRVKGMITNFLFNLWRDGALAGAKAEDAFYVKIGLPETMNAQDILEGRMNVQIGLAAVRPAEFIVLNFSHLLQTS